MTEKKFKTNINCNNCKAAVTPSLNSLEGIDSWEVDTDNPEKVLTVKGEADIDNIVSAIEKVGFKATPYK